MKIQFCHNTDSYSADLSNPIDISLPLVGNAANVNAWYVPHPTITPVTDGDFTGSVAAGASTNFNTIVFNPHAHGTHTECVGHITKEFYSINNVLTKFFFVAQLITVTPDKVGEDRVITKEILVEAFHNKLITEAVVIRTLPNSIEKKGKQYSHTNPPYFSEDAAAYLKENGVLHLLTDLPSVDKEKDNGVLLAHKAFWNYKKPLRLNATITEFVFVDDIVKDGTYLLNLQIASFVNDASPSKPVLYTITQD